MKGFAYRHSKAINTTNLLITFEFIIILFCSATAGNISCFNYCVKRVSKKFSRNAGPSRMRTLFSTFFFSARLSLVVDTGYLAHYYSSDWRSYHLVILSDTHIIGHYNPSFRIIDVVSHTIYIMCINFFSWETFHGNFISLRVLPEICWEEITEEILLVYCFDVWPGVLTLALRLISQHITY